MRGQRPTAVRSAAPDASSGKTEKPSPTVVKKTQASGRQAALGEWKQAGLGKRPLPSFTALHKFRQLSSPS